MLARYPPWACEMPPRVLPVPLPDTARENASKLDALVPDVLYQEAVALGEFHVIDELTTHNRLMAERDFAENGLGTVALFTAHHRPLQHHHDIHVRPPAGIAARLRAEEHQFYQTFAVQILHLAPQIGHDISEFFRYRRRLRQC